MLEWLLFISQLCLIKLWQTHPFEPLHSVLEPDKKLKTTKPSKGGISVIISIADFRFLSRCTSLKPADKLMNGLNYALYFAKKFNLKDDINAAQLLRGHSRCVRQCQGSSAKCNSCMDASATEEPWYIIFEKAQIWFIWVYDVLNWFYKMGVGQRDLLVRVTSFRRSFFFKARYGITPRPYSS